MSRYQGSGFSPSRSRSAAVGRKQSREETARMGLELAKEKEKAQKEKDRRMREEQKKLEMIAQGMGMGPGEAYAAGTGELEGFIQQKMDAAQRAKTDQARKLSAEQLAQAKAQRDLAQQKSALISEQTTRAGETQQRMVNLANEKRAWEDRLEAMNAMSPGAQQTMQGTPDFAAKQQKFAALKQNPAFRAHQAGILPTDDNILRMQQIMAQAQGATEKGKPEIMEDPRLPKGVSIVYNKMTGTFDVVGQQSRATQSDTAKRVREIKDAIQAGDVNTTKILARALHVDPATKEVIEGDVDKMVTEATNQRDRIRIWIPKWQGELRGPNGPQKIAEAIDALKPGSTPPPTDQQKKIAEEIIFVANYLNLKPPVGTR